MQIRHPASHPFPSANIYHLVEQAEAHVVVLRLFILLRFLLRLLISCFRARISDTSGWSRAGILVGVGNAILQLLNTFPLVISLHGYGQNLLVGVDNRVHDGWKGGEVDSEGDGSNSRDSSGESFKQLGFLNVKDIWGEDLTLVVNLRDAHAVCEGGDVQHVEQGSFGGSDLAASLDKLQVLCDLNGTTGNLGGNTEGLEEGSLAGFHASVTGGDVDIVGGDGAGTGRSSDTVLEDLCPDVLEVAVREDESNVA